MMTHRTIGGWGSTPEEAMDAFNRQVADMDATPLHDPVVYLSTPDSNDMLTVVAVCEAMCSIPDDAA
jgi:hypothetical protein